jgi:hypothetical protein
VRANRAATEGGIEFGEWTSRGRCEEASELFLALCRLSFRSVRLVLSLMDSLLRIGMTTGSDVAGLDMAVVVAVERAMSDGTFRLSGPLSLVVVFGSSRRFVLDLGAGGGA